MLCEDTVQIEVELQRDVVAPWRFKCRVRDDGMGDFWPYLKELPAAVDLRACLWFLTLEIVKKS